MTSTFDLTQSTVFVNPSNNLENSYINIDESL